MTGPSGPGGTGPGGPTGPGATPLTTEQRTDNYRRQTGRPLTARQQRRINHKANRAGWDGDDA